jgi:Uma2 family endonuclease
MSAEAMFDRLRPPPGGFTAEDLDRIEGLPPHTELIDGSLITVSPQSKFHALTNTVLENGLRRTVPGNLKVRREMTATLADRQRPEPDVLVVRADGDHDMGQKNYVGDDVVLAVEVVSDESQIRDRKRKPQIYAEAGIPNFWRVEGMNGRAVVYAYELDAATESYALTGVHRDRLKVSTPFDIDIDLTEIERI